MINDYINWVLGADSDGVSNWLGLGVCFGILWLVVGGVLCAMMSDESDWGPKKALKRFIQGLVVTTIGAPVLIVTIVPAAILAGVGWAFWPERDPSRVSFRERRRAKRELEHAKRVQETQSIIQRLEVETDIFGR